MLAVGLVAVFYRAAASEARTKSFDFQGILLLVFSLTSLIYLIENLATSTVFWTSCLLAITVVFLASFVWHEGRVEQPIIPNTLFLNRPYLAQTGIQVIILCVTLAYGIYAPLWAQNVLGTTATWGGATQIASSVLMLIATRITSNIYGRISVKRQIFIGLSALFVSGLMLSLGRAQFPYWYIVVSGAFQGIGMGFNFSILTVTIQESVPKALISIATTLNMLLRTIGQTLAASVYGLLYNQTIDNRLHGAITAKTINDLSASKLVSQLSSVVRNVARQVVFNGIHQVFIVVFGLIIIGVVLNIFAWQGQSTKNLSESRS